MGRIARTALPRSLLTTTLRCDPRCGNGPNGLLWKCADAAPFDDNHALVGYWNGMDTEQTIVEIERLECIFAGPDISAVC